MRPWRTARFIASVDGAKVTVLQCGHGHETVENSCRSLRMPPGPWLQCGHGHETVENPAACCLQYRHRTVLQCGHGHETVENHMQF